MGREEEIVKERKENRRIENLRRFIVEFGHIAIAGYLVLMSITVGYMSVILLYNGHRMVFLEYLIFNDGRLIGDFFVVGFMVAGWVIGMGMLSIWMYMTQQKLLEKGYKKRWGITSKKLLDVKKNNNKIKERDRDV